MRGEYFKFSINFTMSFLLLIVSYLGLYVNFFFHKKFKGRYEQPLNNSNVLSDIYELSDNMINNGDQTHYYKLKL